LQNLQFNDTAKGILLGLFAFILVFSVVPAPIAKAASAPYFSITLIAPTSNPVRRQWAQIIQNSFIAANIQANLVYMSFGQWLGLLLGNSTCGKGGAPAALPVEGAGAQNCPMPSFANGGWDAGFVGAGGGTALPDFGTQNVVYYRGASANDFPPNGSNWYWWSNSTYNTLAADYSNSFNAQTRLADAQQMVKIVADQRPGIVIDYPLEVFAWNPAFKPWGTSSAITTSTAGLDWQHWQTGTVTTINAAVTGGLDSVNPVPNPAQNSLYDRYLYGPVNAAAQAGAGALEEVDARGSGVYINAIANHIVTSADHLRYTVSFKAHTFQDGVIVTADDYLFANMAEAATAVAYVAGGTTLSILGNQDQFTFLNGTTDYLNAGAYQHGGSAPAGWSATSVWKSLNATAFSFTLPAPYLFTDPSITATGALPMHILEQIPFAQWQSSPLSGFTSGCNGTPLWSACSAGGLSQNAFRVTWNAARYGGNGSYVAYGPIGDGAYVYHGYNPVTQTGTLVRFNGYWNATGLKALHEFTIQTVNVISIPSKDSALAAYGNPINFYDSQYTFNKNDATQMAGLGAKVAYVNDPANGYQEMPLNNANPLWGAGTTTPNGVKDPAHAATYAKYVRAALSFLVPRQQIVQNLLLGLGTPGITEFFPTSGIISPGDIYSGLTYDPLNLATALGYLAAAGYNTGYAPITAPGQSSHLLPIPPINVTGISLNVPGFFLGNSFTLTGTFPVVPGTANGYWVTLQESTDGGSTWSPVALGQTTGGGAYSVSYTPESTGNQEYRVFFSGIVSTYTSGAAGPLQSGGLSDVGAALVQSYDFPATTKQCSGLPSRGGTCAANSTDIQYGTPTALNVGTYGDLFSQLATGINNGLTSLAGSTQTAIGTVNTNVGTLSSQITALTTAQGSLAKQSDLAALSTTVSSLNGQVSTLTDVAYAALAVAVILGLLAIFLSRRKVS
jgi:ABC-type transport system substrate-binding protein